MTSETFTIVALPHSHAALAPFHVSVYIAPRLVPDVPNSELAQFPLFENWAALLRGDTTIELLDQDGPIESRALLEPVEPELWSGVFPPDTPVRKPASPDWRQRYWRTFRAAEVHDMAKVLHGVAMALDPTSPLKSDAHPLTQGIETLGIDSFKGGPYDETVITRDLDGQLGESAFQDLKSLDEVEFAISTMAERLPLQRMLIETHRARRFYDRPETAHGYKERPDPDAALLPSPPRPGPDFHERCSIVGDHPVLQRSLGLVVDLQVDDVERLGNSQWLSARVISSGNILESQMTRTLCNAVGDALVSVPSGEDWHNGQLRVGDQGLFAVLDMDPDGTALKLDRYLMTLPRLANTERNGAPVHAAPTALRTSGLTVVRNRRALNTADRMQRQHALETQVAAGDIPELYTEDITHGMRIEVWDDTTSTWHSLHQRTIDVDVLGIGEVLRNATEQGFIQGTAATEASEVPNSPVHVHEALFGWDGWSLSAPRPGQRVRHENGKEEVEENPKSDPDPVTPLLIRPKVEPGTLPRLRYGRSYAFRVWATDLAGNSRPHQIGHVPVPPLPLLRAATEALINSPAVLSRAEFAIKELRAQTAKRIVQQRKPPIAPINPAPMSTLAPVLTPLVEVGVDPAVFERIGQFRRERPGRQNNITSDRASVVASAFADSLLDENQPLLSTTTTIDARVVASGIEAEDVEAPDFKFDTVSPLTPFLRWNPVPPPAIVSRKKHTPGESLRQVVIRSGVEQNLETLVLTVTSPAAYSRTSSPSLGYHATSERHLVPPKSSQSEAELHGQFDAAIGSNDQADHRRALGIALRESGTLFDMSVPGLDDPAQRTPQQGIKLFPKSDATDDGLKTLPLPLGEAPSPGQYVVHDTDQLQMPYLPDVMADGISLVFPEAGRDRKVGPLFGTEGFTARFDGTWPTTDSFRLVLHGSTVLDGRVDGSELSIGLPPGDVQRFRVSCSIAPDNLDLFGPWRILPPSLRFNTDVKEAAADGWFWSLTPFDDVTLVHAVPRPLQIPRVMSLAAHRIQGEVDIGFTGSIDLHGSSTESITVECRWADKIDDVTRDCAQTINQQGIAYSTAVASDEDIAVLVGRLHDGVLNVPGTGVVFLHRAVHLIGDTRHHTMHYRPRATTRFSEYFDETELAPPGNADSASLSTLHPLDDGRSVVGPEFTIEVPSSAPPAAPLVHSVLPLFRWDGGTEPEQPVAVRSRRRAGIRVYLERPWFSSGNGELVGVLLAPFGNQADLSDLVSQWGADPVWSSVPVMHRDVLGLDNLVHALGLDDRPGDAAPVLPPRDLPLTTVKGQPATTTKEHPIVTVLGYEPQYNEDRKLWYVDIALDPGSTFWPFVRLSLVRYQPNSIDGCHLSKPVLCDFVQLTPERTTSVSRTDDRHVRVVVSGPVGVRVTNRRGDLTGVLPTEPAELISWIRVNRQVIATLQRWDPEIPTDLGWITEHVQELTVRGYGRNVAEVSWVGALEAPTTIPLHRPGESKGWRVTVEEWERMPGDPDDLSDTGAPPVWEQRIVYADEFLL